MLSLNSIHTTCSDLTLSVLPFRFFAAISLSFIYHPPLFYLTGDDYHVIFSLIVPAQILNLNSLCLLQNLDEIQKFS